MIAKFPKTDISFSCLEISIVSISAFFICIIERKNKETFLPVLAIKNVNCKTLC